MSFSFNRINEAATIERSKYMLKNYVRYHRVEKRKMVLLKSPSLSGMPKGNSAGNNADENIIKSIDAHDYCELCRNTIECLESDTFREILTMTYIKPHYDQSYIANKIGFSRQWLYRCRKEALLAYAEVCPGMPDIDYVNGGKMVDLIVWY